MLEWVNYTWPKLWARCGRLACRQIFKNVAEPGRQDLVLSDFEKYLPPDKAMQAFASFEVTVNGTITKESVMKWVVDVYNERKSLSLTLNDNRTVIYNVNRLLDLVLSTFTWTYAFLIPHPKSLLKFILNMIMFLIYFGFILKKYRSF